MKSPRELTSARKNIGNSSDRKQQAEQFVADHVGKLHGSLLYGVDQAGSIDEVASRADQRAEEHRQFFRSETASRTICCRSCWQASWLAPVRGRPGGFH